MSRQKPSGNAQTVQGTIDAGEMGITLAHEHLLCDSSFRFTEPEKASHRALAYAPISIENLEWIKRNQNRCLDNLRLLDEELAIAELLPFKKEGGGTVVDMGNIGLRRDPAGLARISRASGVNIIMGAGYYVGSSHPPELASKTVDVITDEIVHDITVGVGDTGIKAGVIGEIGCSYPLKDTEVKVLGAVARAQEITGAPVNIHPGQSQTSPIEIIELLRDNGGDIDSTAMSHVGNRHGNDIDLTLELAETGCSIEYDSFGSTQNPIKLPNKIMYGLSDWERIGCIKHLIDHGYLHQILVSHDVFNKTDLRHYGGPGYDHLLTTVVPLMRMKGITDAQIHVILEKNPEHMLQFAAR
jgi:phosphotriesterase-related protein